MSDRPDGLIPTVVVDEDMVSLGLCYSKRESLAEAIKRRVGVYWSRTRGLWVKGLTSGATQDLIRVDLDCDRDSMRCGCRRVYRPHGCNASLPCTTHAVRFPFPCNEMFPLAA